MNTKTKIKSTNLSLIPLIAEGERILSAAIKHFGLKTKPESITLTIQSKGRKNALGWFWPNGWKKADQRNHEINLSAETLRECELGEVLIHELAHAENATLGIKDCSASQCHNKHFKTMAEKLGLEVNKKRDKRYGFGFTKLGTQAKAFLAEANFDHKLFAACRIPPTSNSKQTTRLVKAECSDCGYTVRVTRKWLDQVGAPLCPCNKRMMAYEMPEFLGGEDSDDE